MYEVIDLQTKERARKTCVHASLRRATARAEQLNLAYGAHRYFARPVGERQPKQDADKAFALAMLGCPVHGHAMRRFLKDHQGNEFGLCEAVQSYCKVNLPHLTAVRAFNWITVAFTLRSNGKI